MLNTLKFYLLLLGLIPFVPFLIVEGKRIRKTIPKLKEPTDNQGISGEYSESIKLLSIGESTIAGVGVKSHQNGLTGHLAKMITRDFSLKVEWQVFAKSGLTAATLNRKITSSAIQFSPDLILIGLGGNDAFHLTSPKKWKSNLEHLLGTVRKKFPSSIILFANLPPTSKFPAFSRKLQFFLGRLTSLHQVELEKLVKDKEGVFFSNAKIELSDWEKEADSIEELFSDGVHPSSVAYRLWAEEIALFIQENKLV